MAAVFIPLIILTINHEDVGNTIVLYLGAIFGGVISIFGAVLAVFYSFRNQQIDQLKINASKKIYSLSIIEEKANRFLLYSLKEDILDPNEVGREITEKDFLSYVRRFKELYASLINLSLEIDIYFYRYVEKLFAEINEVAGFFEIYIITEVEFEGLHKVTFKEFEMFEEKNISIIIKGSDKLSKKKNEPLFEDRDKYNLYELDTILKRAVNGKSHQLKKKIEKERNKIISQI